MAVGGRTRVSREAARRGDLLDLVGELLRDVDVAGGMRQLIIEAGIDQRPTIDIAGAAAVLAVYRPLLAAAGGVKLVIEGGGSDPLGLLKVDPDETGTGNFMIAGRIVTETKTGLVRPVVLFVQADTCIDVTT